MVRSGRAVRARSSGTNFATDSHSGQVTSIEPSAVASTVSGEPHSEHSSPATAAAATGSPASSGGMVEVPSGTAPCSKVVTWWQEAQVPVSTRASSTE
jgi:hypothetical protein